MSYYSTHRANWKCSSTVWTSWVISLYSKQPFWQEKYILLVTGNQCLACGCCPLNLLHKSLWSARYSSSLASLNTSWTYWWFIQPQVCAETPATPLRFHWPFVLWMCFHPFWKYVHRSKHRCLHSYHDKKLQRVRHRVCVCVCVWTWTKWIHLWIMRILQDCCFQQKHSVWQVPLSRLL